MADTAGLLLPAAIAGFGWGDWRGGIFVAALTKAVCLQHSTFFINSLAHIWGDHTFSDQRTPRDNWLVSLVTFGEGQRHALNRLVITAKTHRPSGTREVTVMANTAGQ